MVDDEVTDETRECLSGDGDVTVCQTKDEWLSAIREPSTSLIGVEKDGKGIRIILSVVSIYFQKMNRSDKSR